MKLRLFLYWPSQPQETKNIFNNKKMSIFFKRKFYMKWCLFLYWPSQPQETKREREHCLSLSQTNLFSKSRFVKSQSFFEQRATR